MIDDWGISCEIAIIWMSLDFTDDQSTLVQVMAWCHQATSHYLSQYWPRSLSPYGLTRPQWFNTLRPAQNGCRQQFWLQFWNEKKICIAITVDLKCVFGSLNYHMSALVQLIALCCQATDHYQMLCWLRSIMPFGINGTQFFKTIIQRQMYLFCIFMEEYIMNVAYVFIYMPC